jgi:hypothetical protein
MKNGQQHGCDQRCQDNGEHATHEKAFKQPGFPLTLHHDITSQHDSPG